MVGFPPNQIPRHLGLEMRSHTEWRSGAGSTVATYREAPYFLGARIARSYFIFFEARKSLGPGVRGAPASLGSEDRVASLVRTGRGFP